MVVNTNPLQPNTLLLQSPSYPGQRQAQLRVQQDSQNQLTRKQESLDQPPVEFVYQGEILESESYHKNYQPQLNQQIAPQNRSAINNYHSTNRGGREIRNVGLILNRYI